MATLRREIKSTTNTVGTIVVSSNQLATNESNINVTKPVGVSTNIGASGVWVDDPSITPAVEGAYGINTVRIPLSSLTFVGWGTGEYGDSVKIGTIPDGCVIIGCTMYVAATSGLAIGTDVTCEIGVGFAAQTAGTGTWDAGANDLIAGVQWYDGDIVPALLTAGTNVPYDSIVENSGTADTAIYINLLMPEGAAEGEYASMAGNIIITYIKASVGITALTL